MNNENLGVQRLLWKNEGQSRQNAGFVSILKRFSRVARLLLLSFSIPALLPGKCCRLFMAPINQPYLFSFTTGGLLVNECRVVVGSFQKTKDWDTTLLEVRSGNLLQTRTVATTDKRFREVRRRLECLNQVQLSLLQQGNQDEQIAMVWLGTCKAYRIIREFAVEFVRDRFLTMQMTVAPADFDKFIDSKALWDSTLDDLAESTRTRLRRVVYQMLREAGIVSAGLVRPSNLSSSTVAALKSDSAPMYRIFPVSDRDFARLAG